MRGRIDGLVDLLQRVAIHDERVVFQPGVPFREMVVEHPVRDIALEFDRDQAGEGDIEAQSGGPFFSVLWASSVQMPAPTRTRMPKTVPRRTAQPLQRLVRFGAEPALLLQPHQEPLGWRTQEETHAQHQQSHSEDGGDYRADGGSVQAAIEAQDSIHRLAQRVRNRIVRKPTSPTKMPARTPAAVRGPNKRTPNTISPPSTTS